MTQNFKDALTIILKCYKKDKINEEEVLTLLETVITENNNSGGSIITYPVYPSYPNYPNWWDTIRYNSGQPYCGDGNFCYTTTTDGSFNNNEKQNNETYRTNISGQ